MTLAPIIVPLMLPHVALGASGPIPTAWIVVFILSAALLVVCVTMLAIDLIRDTDHLMIASLLTMLLAIAIPLVGIIAEMIYALLR